MDEKLQQMIRSREFTFCGRCGHICRIGGEDFMCSACMRSFFRSDKPMTDEDKLSMKFEKQISDETIEYRQQLAELRLSKQGEQT